MSEPVFFETLADWRAWLKKNHDRASEVLVGFRKRSTGEPSITWKESVDGALAFGWIDGVRRTIDDKTYSIRFTPRKKGSIWSAINIKRVGELKEAGLMHAAGLATFDARDPAKANRYSFEQAKIELPHEFERRFKADKRAWAFFEAQPPSYRRPALWWVVSAKQEATRERRLAALIEDSRDGRRLKHLTRPVAAKKT